MATTLMTQCVICSCPLQWLASAGKWHGLEQHHDMVHPGTRPDRSLYDYNPSRRFA